MKLSSSPVMIANQPVGRWRASWLLVSEAWRYLKADKELITLPIYATIVLVFLFGLLLVLVLAVELMVGNALSYEVKTTIQFLLFVVGSYALSALVFAFVRGMITHTIITRVANHDATLSQSLLATWRHLGNLFLWSLISATVGLALKFLTEKSEYIGDVVAGLIGGAWSLATYFVIPAMVVDNKNVTGAMQQSALVFRHTWGESLITNISVSLVFILAQIVVAAVLFGGIFLGIEFDWSLFTVLFGLVWLVWFLVSLAMVEVIQSIVVALLYVYATAETPPANFNRELLGAILTRSNKVDSDSPVSTTVIEVSDPVGETEVKTIK